MNINEQTKTNKWFYSCERCGGHGGGYLENGHMPCFNCGDSGWQERKPSWMVQGPFCRGIVSTPFYRQGWYYPN
jgi:hypothetical protein